MRDPFAVGCRARNSLGWPEQKALVLAVAMQPDGLPAWSYAAQLADLFGIAPDVQEGLFVEAGEHRRHAEGEPGASVDTVTRNP